jgi:ACS family sodium-dependent inorganic phosphate cotransporter
MVFQMSCFSIGMVFLIIYSMPSLLPCFSKKSYHELMCFILDDVGLCISRAAVGLGEALAPAAATDIIARVVPASERSRAVAFVFSGLHLGSMLCLLVVPSLISNLGWAAVFVSFGVLGMVWCLWFEGLLRDIEEADPDMAALLAGRMRSISGGSVEGVEEEGSGHGGHGGVIDADMPIPWRAFLRSTSVQALMYTHFCNNWLHYTVSEGI